jgi:hypothetical protein
VAVGILCLMLPRTLRETEDTPVLDASDCASRSKDEGAGSAGDSRIIDQRALGSESVGRSYSLTSKRFPGRTY